MDAHYFEPAAHDDEICAVCGHDPDTDFHWWDDDLGYDDDDGLSDVEADAMTLREIGWGPDEDYGYYERN